MNLRDWRASKPEPVDPSLRRFCPRCNTVTVWDTTGDLTYCCTNYRPGEPEFCGFTIRDTLTDEEARRMDAYEQRINPPRASRSYLVV